MFTTSCSYNGSVNSISVNSVVLNGCIEPRIRAARTRQSFEKHPYHIKPFIQPSHSRDVDQIFHILYSTSSTQKGIQPRPKIFLKTSIASISVARPWSRRGEVLFDTNKRILVVCALSFNHLFEQGRAIFWLCRSCVLSGKSDETRLPYLHPLARTRGYGVSGTILERMDMARHQAGAARRACRARGMTDVSSRQGARHLRCGSRAWGRFDCSGPSSQPR